MERPDFNTKEELFAWLVENKETLKAQKKAVTKYADPVGMGADAVIEARKSDSDSNDLVVTAIINTTNLMDSHDDVHIPGLWSKSLKENKMIMHLQEHQMAFDKIISDGKDLKASAKTYSWAELGAKLDGQTQALVFESTIKADRNPFMYNQYAQGRVKNHSVGMRYVKLFLAINDENYDTEYGNWKKYIDQVANRKAAEDNGFFWAVTEAKVIEGSAVPLGSNTITPTLDIKEPLYALHKEPAEATLDDVKEIFKELLN